MGHELWVTCNEGKVVYISESGLYSLILKSWLPAEKSFKKWVTSEALPSACKTGGYELQDQELDKAKTMKQLSIKDSAIEEKYAALALIHDSLRDRDNQIQFI